jgi:hypothetical protein
VKYAVVASLLCIPALAHAQTAAPPPPAYSYPPEPPPPVERDGTVEVTVDFAALGVLGIADLMTARHYSDPRTGVLLVLGGAFGGGGLGWMIADHLHVTRAEGNAASAGLGLGVLDAALLLEPMNLDNTGTQVMTSLLVGGAAGTAAGLALGRNLHLTEGQTYFATNIGLLGVGSAAVVAAVTDKRGDGRVDAASWDAMLIGLDGGAAAGVLLAPKIHWSRGRARFVGAASLVGTLIGGAVGTLLATRTDPQTGTSTTNPDIAAGSMLVGMWGGFAGGVMLSNDWAPDPRYRAAPAPALTPAPMLGNGRVGAMVAGSF